jgi:hypothetical protein
MLGFNDKACYSYALQSFHALHQRMLYAVLIFSKKTAYFSKRALSSPVKCHCYFFNKIIFYSCRRR